MPLVCCDHCARHVREGASVCPFCDAALRSSAPPSRRISRGASRAMIFTVGAALLGAAGCDDPPSDGDAGPVQVDSGNVAMPYGAPPADHLL